MGNELDIAGKRASVSAEIAQAVKIKIARIILNEPQLIESAGRSEGANGEPVRGKHVKTGLERAGLNVLDTGAVLFLLL